MQEETSRKDDPTDRLVEYLRDTFAGEATPATMADIGLIYRCLVRIIDAQAALLLASLSSKSEDVDKAIKGLEQAFEAVKSGLDNITERVKPNDEA